MPIHLPPISRRGFLATSIAATAASLLPRELLAQDKAVDPNSFAILSDSHISGDPDRVMNKVHLANHFKQAAREVLALPARPAAVLVNGDLAVIKGEVKDYAVFAKLLEPMRDEGKLPVYLTLGNHDHRENFLEALGAAKQGDEAKVAEGRHVHIIESPRANWFLLDTLDQTNVTPGLVGEAQLKWLAAALDARTDKPAIIVAHHPHELSTPKATFGLKDTDALLAMLVPRRQVKLFIHGHSHNWRFTSYEDIHIVSLPPTAYVFNASKPNGWVHAMLKDNGATMELRALDAKHPEHGRVTELGWRSDK